jgi:hypothetical protein
VDIYNNVFWSVLHYKTIWIGWPLPAGMEHQYVRIMNNTFHTYRTAIACGGDDYATNRDLIVLNNLFYDYAPDANNIHYAVDLVQTITAGYNRFWTPVHSEVWDYIANTTPTYLLLSEWQALGYDTNSTWGDPLLVSTNRTSMKLQAGSPCVGAGTNLNAYFTTDRDGVVRGGSWDIGAYQYAESLPQVATPGFSPAAGSYESSVEITLSCATGGAAIYFTLDGSTPDAADTLYSAPFTRTSTTTVKAIGILVDYTDSEVASATYTITAPAPAASGSATVTTLTVNTIQ